VRRSPLTGERNWLGRSFLSNHKPKRMSRGDVQLRGWCLYERLCCLHERILTIHSTFSEAPDRTNTTLSQTPHQHCFHPTSPLPATESHEAQAIADSGHSGRLVPDRPCWKTPLRPDLPPAHGPSCSRAPEATLLLLSKEQPARARKSQAREPTPDAQIHGTTAR
jgi:hypothetical protein